ncbi:unnamed protein product [Trichobilharzia regenti]|nr:unnamed protein product [Trichobilharzia regenti]
MESIEISPSSPSTSLSSVSMGNGTSTSSMEESISMNITEGFSAESFYKAVTSSVRDIINTITTLPLHHDHITTPHSEFACVGSELSEPDFQLYACSGSKITSWIASVFLICMSIFGIISKYLID